MSAPAFTPGPLKVVIDGTLTGVWAEVSQECVDPATGNEWSRELCRTDTIYVRREDAYDREAWGDFAEAPDQYRMEPDGEENLANARLWAAAPELYEALLELASAVATTTMSSAAITRLEPVLGKAKATLAKARGLSV